MSAIVKLGGNLSANGSGYLNNKGRIIEFFESREEK